MKILGAGLSRTGTHSLCVALRYLGYRAIHGEPERLQTILRGAFPMDGNFRRYDDVDAVLDIPAAYFYRELLSAYPDAMVILTVREIESWWRSIERHSNVTRPVTPVITMSNSGHFNVNVSIYYYLRNIVYGSHRACEFMYKKRYVEHNEAVHRTVPRARLLIMDVCSGDGWGKLCSFLGHVVPDCDFPHESIAKTK